MIELPDPTKAFEYENNFYLTCDPQRIKKFLAHVWAFTRALRIPGALVECGVFKGASFSSFAVLREIFNAQDRPLVGFDTFDAYPKTDLRRLLARKFCDRRVDLVAGDICETVPTFVEENPGVTIAFLNLDVNIYEPAAAVLAHLYPKLSRGGILLLNNYGVFPGETMAADDYFRQTHPDVKIQAVEYCHTISYVVKP